MLHESNRIKRNGERVISMNIFDTHCDTALEIFRNKLSLKDGNTAFSLDKAEKYEKKFQVFAFWSDCEKDSEECYNEFLKCSSYFDKQIDENSERIKVCRTSDDIKNTENGVLGAVKCVEGAKLLCGRADRIETLYENSVKVLLPVWGGTDIVGGAWDTDDGLSGFGKNVVRECENMGIITDVSHMSDKSFYDTLSNASVPVIASHSNARAICNTKRNITDQQFRIIKEQKGIVGVSLAAKHISDKYFTRMPREDEDFVYDTALHILHYLELDGENCVCLGCDFDGTDAVKSLPDVSFMNVLYEKLLDMGVNKKEADKIFFENAYRFFEENL